MTAGFLLGRCVVSHQRSKREKGENIFGRYAVLGDKESNFKKGNARLVSFQRDISFPLFFNFTREREKKKTRISLFKTIRLESIRGFLMSQ